MWLFLLVGFGVMALAHVAPAEFILDAMAGDRAVWHMPRRDPPTVYLTYDDGPNPTTTPELLDLLAHERVRATFFLIDEHVTEETAPIVRRMFSEGHAVALHSRSRRHLLMSPSQLGRTLGRAAKRIRALAGEPPCRAYRPHAGWRSGSMYVGLQQIGFRLIGWSWMLWDFDPRGTTADRTFRRIAPRASAGDIIVMHDGDSKAPRRDRQPTIDATARLIPALRARGLAFETVCENGR